MLKVLNQKERNQAFIQFLFFFVVTTALIVGAIYFDFNLPVKQNRKYRDEISAGRNATMNQQRFIANMKTARLLLDSLDKSGVNIKQLDIQLTHKLNELSNFSQDDSSAYGLLNNALSDAFLELQRTKKDLANFRETAGKVNALEQELKECSIRLDGYIQRTSQAGAGIVQ